MHGVTFAKEKAPFLNTCVLFKQALAQRFESKMQTRRTQERKRWTCSVETPYENVKRSEEEERAGGRGYFTHTQKKSVFTLVTCTQYEKKTFEVLKIICINFYHQQHRLCTIILVYFLYPTIKGLHYKIVL